MDEDIEKLCRSDKDKGFRCLIERYQQPLYWHIRRMLVDHDDTEDVLQETFLRAYRHWDSFRGTSKRSTWLYKIATNEVLRFMEKNKRIYVPVEDVDKEEGVRTPDANEELENAEQIRMLQEAIQALPEKQRLVFNLRYYDEMQYSEISEILNTQVETLKTNFFYAKENIKKYIRRNYYERA